MLDNLFTVAAQVLMLFTIIFVGYICGKAKLIRERSIEGLSNIVLYAATPAAILQSFTTQPRTAETTLNLVYVFLTAVLIHVVFIIVSRLTIRNKDERSRRIMQFAVVFSNCGYMSFPLQKAILDDIGVFYGAMFVAVFNIFLWTYGALLASGDKRSLEPKKILLNPTIICVVISILLYAFQIKLPSFLAGAVSSIGNLNTPLPMLIIGFNLSTIKLSEIFLDKRIYWPSALRLIVFPAIALGFMMLIGIKGIPLVACTVAASAPTAAASVMFASKYGLDPSLASKITSFSTLLSIFTMPIFVMFAQAL